MADSGGIVALLFTDIVGSTTMYDRLGDNRAEALRRAHFAGLRQALAAHGGREVKSLGDGLMVTFSSAVAAVEAAIAMQRAAVASAPSSMDGPAPQLRVGPHAGEPIQDEDDYFGVSVNIARRLCDLAAPGHIVASDLVRALVSPRMRNGLQPLGPLTLKGIDEPVEGYDVEWTPAASLATVPVALSNTSDVPFVGRQADLDVLVQLWKQVATGTGGVVLVSGEPGIGKTRLVSELGRRAADAGALLLAGRSDAELLVPLEPFAEAIREAAASWPHEARSALSNPALEPLLRVSGAVSELRDTERTELFAAVTEAIGRAQAHLPVLLVLDDVHWADEATVLLLRALLRSRPPRLLVVLTYRDTDLSRTHPLAALVADLRRQDGVTRIPLRGLTLGAITQLLGGDDKARTSLANRIVDETEGNPFFVTEVIRHLAEQGRLRPTDDGWIIAGVVETIDVPEGIREVIGRRMSRLSDSCNEVLAAASVVGRSFSARVVASAASKSLEDTLDAIDEAIESHLVEEQVGRLGVFGFSHALVREALYAEVSTIRRLRLHLAIGRALQSMGGTPAEIAHHLIEAGPAGSLREAAEATVVAAVDARNRLAAYEDAATLCRRALVLLGDDEPDLRCDLLTFLGDSLSASGSGDDAGISILGEAIEMARRMEDGDRLARALTYSFRAGIATASVPSYLDAADHALRLLPAGVTPTTARLRAALALGRLAPEQSPAYDVDNILRDALESRDPEAISYAALARADAYTAAGDSQAASRVLDETVALVMDGASLALIPYGMRRFTIALQAGDRDGAEAELARTQVEVDRRNALEWAVRGPQAVLALLDGDLDAATERASGLRNDQGSPMLLMTAYERGASQSVLPLLEARARVAWDPGFRAAVALFLVDGGRFAEALEWIEGLIRDVGRDFATDLTLAMLAEVVLALSDAATAAAVRARLADSPTPVIVASSFLCFGARARYAGLCAAAVGDLDGAVDVLREAIDVNEQIRSPLFAGHSRVDLADVLLRRGGAGDREAALVLASGVAADVAGSDLGRLARRASGVLARASETA